MICKIGVAITALAIASPIDVAAERPAQAGLLVRGRIVTEPVCPGPSRLDNRDCVPRALQGTVKVFSLPSGGREIKLLATVTTNYNGRFQLRLVPGAYRFVPTSPEGISIGKPREVKVIAGEVAEVQLVVDTGMR